MVEKIGNNSDLEIRMENILRVSSSYFNLAALLTGLNISALFIYIIRPGEYSMTVNDSIIIFFLTISMILYIAGTIMFSFVYERVSSLKSNKEIKIELLKKKVFFNELEIAYARKSTIGGLTIMLMTAFYLIVTIDIYLGFFTVLSAFGLFFILGVLRIKSFKKAGLIKKENN